MSKVSWKGSVQPRKQRKFQYTAAEHQRGKFLHARVSKELQQKYNKRSIRVRTGDKVKVLRGQFKGKIGSVDSVDLLTNKITIQKVDVVKKDGSKSAYAIHASNVQLIDLKIDDKKRIASFGRGKKVTKPKATKPVQEKPAKTVAKPEVS